MKDCCSTREAVFIFQPEVRCSAGPLSLNFKCNDEKASVSLEDAPGLTSTCGDGIYTPIVKKRTGLSQERVELKLLPASREPSAWNLMAFSRTPDLDYRLSAN